MHAFKRTKNICRDWEKHGLNLSLEHQLWEVLKHHAKGLTVPDIEKELDKSSDSGKVHTLLPFMYSPVPVSI